MVLENRLDLTIGWLKSYLEKRSQICKVNDVTSSPKHIHCGVLQRSNLGPLLFLVYINDLPAMYADDTNMSSSGSSIKELENKLNTELNYLYDLLTNKLTLNISKTEYMIIGTSQRLSNNTESPTIRIGGSDLKRVSVTKSLGILIDENLNWKPQVENISKKVSQRIGILRRVKQYMFQYDLYKYVISLLFCLILTIALWFGEIATRLNNRSYKNSKTELQE